MDDLARAMDRAVDAARPHASVAPYVEHAVALARFQAHDPAGGPFRHEPLSSAVPLRPTHPMFPAFAAARGDARLDPLMEALEAFQHELVWAADCAEYTDANLNAAQYLRAAGHLDLAAQAVLALAGSGLGLVLAAPDKVRGLAAGLGLQVSHLIAEGERSMGFLPSSPAAPDAGVQASYRWDIHHENPVTSVDDLARRELTSYTVRFAHGRARCEAALPGAPSHVNGRRRYGAFFLDDADTDAFALEWYADEPAWAIPPRDQDIAALAERLRAARDLAELPLDHNGGYEFRPPVGALELARGLGAPDAFACTVDVHMSSWRLTTPAGELRVGDWSIEASLARSPSGEPVPGITLPASLTAVLGDDDVVRYLYVRRRA